MSAILRTRRSYYYPNQVWLLMGWLSKKMNKISTKTRSRAKKSRGKHSNDERFDKFMG